LNPSELNLAKKLNLTPEQYAKAKLEMEAWKWLKTENRVNLKIDC
jgi:hypothetical protein